MRPDYRELAEAVPQQEPAQEEERKLEMTALFFFERAEREYESAERKREAAMTKATAIAALAAALSAIVAAPAFDAGGLAHGASRWILLVAVALFLASIFSIAKAILIHVSPGERVSREELDNWTSEQFWFTDVVTHALDLTKGFVAATKGIRTANERAETWITWATACIAAGLFLLLLAFFVEMV